jgi:hypothetical protein
MGGRFQLIALLIYVLLDILKGHTKPSTNPPRGELHLSCTW